MDPRRRGARPPRGRIRAHRAVGGLPPWRSRRAPRPRRPAARPPHQSRWRRPGRGHRTPGRVRAGAPRSTGVPARPSPGSASAPYNHAVVALPEKHVARRLGRRAFPPPADLVRRQRISGFLRFSIVRRGRRADTLRFQPASAAPQKKRESRRLLPSRRYGPQACPSSETLRAFSNHRARVRAMRTASAPLGARRHHRKVRCSAIALRTARRAQAKAAAVGTPVTPASTPP